MNVLIMKEIMINEKVCTLELSSNAAFTPPFAVVKIPCQEGDLRLVLKGQARWFGVR